jgi:hypothetical protein
MMWGMTQDQITNLVRQFLMAFGTLAATLGWAPPEKIAGWTTSVLALIGPLFMTTSLVWGLVKNTQANIVTSAATQTDANGVNLLKKVSINPLAQGAAELNKVTPANVVIERPVQASMSGIPPDVYTGDHHG